MAWELTERRARRFHIGHGGLSATSDRLETFEIFFRGEVWTLSESRAPFRDSSGLSCATSEVSSIPQLVTNDMNSTLTENFQAWEVECAIKQMAPLKALGPDGMPPLFFQNYWELVKGDITNTILSFLNSGSLPSPINHTFVTLIPKIKNPERVTEFRPISLCNVLYKIFSEVLENRLKRVLPLIISEH